MGQEVGRRTRVSSSVELFQQSSGQPACLLQLFCWVGKGGRSQKADAEAQLVRPAAADSAGKGMKLLGPGGGGAPRLQPCSFQCPEMIV